MESIKFYKEIDGELYRRARVEMENKVNALYVERVEANWMRRREIEKEVNERVEAWNLLWGKGPDYLDLHGMTLWGAKHFVARMVKRMKGQKLFLEVGQGNHSRGGIPVIKWGLINEYRKAIKVYDRNKGILVLNLRKVRNGHY
ncbi:unnamed protein product [Caenorhabditis brenneri]